MEIPQKLVKFKYHFLVAVALLFFLSLFFLILHAPPFLTLLAYFWPLFLSTALFLAAVLVFGRNSPPPTPADKLGGGILDYVAGQPEQPVQTYKD